MSLTAHDKRANLESFPMDSRKFFLSYFAGLSNMQILDLEVGFEVRQLNAPGGLVKKNESEKLAWRVLCLWRIISMGSDLDLSTSVFNRRFEGVRVEVESIDNSILPTQC